VTYRKFTFNAVNGINSKTTNKAKTTAYEFDEQTSKLPFLFYIHCGVPQNSYSTLNGINTKQQTNKQQQRNIYSMSKYLCHGNPYKTAKQQQKRRMFL